MFVSFDLVFGVAFESTKCLTLNFVLGSDPREESLHHRLLVQD